MGALSVRQARLPHNSQSASQGGEREHLQLKLAIRSGFRIGCEQEYVQACLPLAECVVEDRESCCDHRPNVFATVNEKLAMFTIERDSLGFLVRAGRISQ